LQETVFSEFYALWPEKFVNITNGVTQRRWLAFCNPNLRQLITRSLGTEDWIKCDPNSA
jgi:starch phosphorylase